MSIALRPLSRLEGCSEVFCSISMVSRDWLHLKSTFQQIYNTEGNKTGPPGPSLISSCNKINGKKAINNQESKQKPKQEDPQIPQPDLRFATETNSETTRERGRGPTQKQTNTHTICH